MGEDRTCPAKFTSLGRFFYTFWWLFYWKNLNKILGRFWKNCNGFRFKSQPTIKSAHPTKDSLCIFMLFCCLKIKHHHTYLFYEKKGRKRIHCFSRFTSALKKAPNIPSMSTQYPFRVHFRSLPKNK